MMEILYERTGKEPLHIWMNLDRVTALFCYEMNKFYYETLFFQTTSG